MSVENRKVCILDDDQQVIALAKGLVSGMGMEIDGFTDADEFKQYLTANRIDIAIVDLILPDEDGYELTKWIRKNHPYTRVINVTAGAPVLTLLACWRTGSDACVLKGAEFVPLLRDALGTSTSALDQWNTSVATVRANSKRSEW